MTISPVTVEDSGLKKSAADCALLVALPLEREAFGEDVAAARIWDSRQARGDYALAVTIDSGLADADEAWSTHGATVAMLCKDLINEARSAGACFISETADADSFRRASISGASVLILVAHWKGSDIVRRDIGPGLGQRLRKLMEEPADAFEVRLATQLNDFGFSTVGEINLALNTFIQSSDDPAGSRDELDRRLAGDIVPGGCVELRDGYYKPHELAHLISPAWAGLIDLNVCHSIRLAAALKQERGDRLVITNEAQKFPARCLRELREVFARLAVAGHDYLALRRDIFVAYSKLVGKEPRNAS